MSQREAWTWRHAILKSDLPPTTRHVLLTLACHISDAGDACHPTVQQLTEETGLSKRAVLTHLKAAEAAGWISVGMHGFGGQKWARNEYRITVPGTSESVPAGSLKSDAQLEILSEKGGERGAPPLQKGGERRAPPFAEGGERGAPEGGERRAPSNFLGIISPPIVPPKTGGTPGFLRFWQAYPNKVKRANAFRYWQRHGLEAVADEVCQGVEAWKKSKRFAEGYIVNPASFLSDERWRPESWPPEVKQSQFAQHASQCCVCGAPWVVQIGTKRYCAAHHPERVSKQPRQGQLCES